MEEKNKYNIRTDFLPKEGIVYVDTCGFEWVCPIYGRDVKSEKASLKKLKSFCKTFRKRGHISTSEGVLEEIQRSKNYWIRKKKEVKKVKRYFRSGGYKRVRNGDNSKKRYKLFAEWLKANNSIYDILKEGIELYSSNNNSPNLNGMEKFIENYKGLSDVDKSLVCTALNSGSGNGILSADLSLLGAYYDGVAKFGLEGCFICNSKESKTIHLD